MHWIELCSMQQSCGLCRMIDSANEPWEHLYLRMLSCLIRCTYMIFSASLSCALNYLHPIKMTWQIAFSWKWPQLSLCYLIDPWAWVALTLWRGGAFLVLPIWCFSACSDEKWAGAGPCLNALALNPNLKSDTWRVLGAGFSRQLHATKRTFYSFLIRRRSKKFLTFTLGQGMKLTFEGLMRSRQCFHVFQKRWIGDRKLLMVSPQTLFSNSSCPSLQLAFSISSKPYLYSTGSS